MISKKQFKIKDQRVIHESLNNETIIINLETGVYYSLNNTGSLVWKGLGLGISPDAISHSLQSKYNKLDGISDAVIRMTETFLNEALIEEVGDLPVNEPLFTDALNAETGSFVLPSAEKYVDMQDMLLADPIHEVVEEGWPKLKKDDDSK